MTHLWSARFGDESNQYAGTVAADGWGNAIVAGDFYDGVDFGCGMLASAGNRDIFLAKIDSGGACVWSKRFGDGVDQFVYDAAVDGSGHVVVTGIFHGSVDFGGGALSSAGGADIFVAKFAADGSHVWSKRFGDGASQIASSVAVDAAENVILAGQFYGSVDFGGGALSSAGMVDIFVAKFSSSGDHIWSKRFGDPGSQVANAAAVDGWGNVVVVGYFYGSVDFGGGVLASAGTEDIYIVKFAGDGSHLWSRHFNDGISQEATSVAVDGLGGVIVAGHFSGELDFGLGPLRGAGGTDIFLVKFDDGGVPVWNKRFGDGEYQYPGAVAAGRSDEVYLTGHFAGNVDFGGGALASAGSEDVFVAKLSTGGSHLWSRRFGDGDEQYGRGVAIDASGDAIITGHFRGAVDLGGGVLSSAGYEDVFVARFGLR